MARDGNNYHYNSGLQSMYLIKTPIPGIGDCQVSSVGPNSGAVHPDILPMRAVISFAMLPLLFKHPYSMTQMLCFSFPFIRCTRRRIFVVCAIMQIKC